MRILRLRALTALVALGVVLGLGSEAALLAVRATPVHASGITTTISANPSSQWPTRSTTITVTSTGDFSAFFFLPSVELVDLTTNQTYTTCSLTSCSWSVTASTPGAHVYEGLLIPFGGGAPIDQSGPLTFTWLGVNLSLAASNHQPLIGQTVVLTATTSADVGPSPFYTQIYDLTTGTRLTTNFQCGTGTTCAVAVTYTVSTAHAFMAYE